MDYYDNDYLMHHGIKGMKWGVRRFQKKDGALTSAGRKRYTNSQIKRDMNKTFDRTYKDLHEQYKKYNPATAADRAYAQAKKINAKHLVDTYGKDRMDQYYETERKKTLAAGMFLVGTMAGMSVVALVADKK